MTVEQCYAALNGNYEEAKGRLMNDKLISRFILKFPSDPSMTTLMEKVAEDDREEAFRAVHTLKGVAANLAFTQLYRDASALTEQMRSLEEPADTSLVQNVMRSYQLVIDTIKVYEESASA